MATQANRKVQQASDRNSTMPAQTNRITRLKPANVPSFDRNFNLTKRTTRQKPAKRTSTDRNLNLTKRATRQSQPRTSAGALSKTTLRLLVATLTLVASQRIVAQEEEIVNTTTSECEEVMVPMCRGLVDYNHTRLPNRFNHTSQEQVYWALQPWWPFMDMGCSDNLRIFLCALYLPRCTPGIPTLTTDPPCRKTCKKAKARCEAVINHHGLAWEDAMSCESLSGFKKSQSCVRPKRETNKKRRQQITECQPNPLPMCQHMPYTLGSLPNPFLQNDLDEIGAEIQQYTAMVESGCSSRLSFLLCGAFMPFCIHGPGQDRPYVIPCREVCQQVQHDCRREFHDAWGGLPWPSKLHCHRYPSHTSNYLQEDNTTVPCSMPPVGF